MALGRSLGWFWCLGGVLEALGGSLDRFVEALGRILGALAFILGSIFDQKSMYLLIFNGASPVPPASESRLWRIDSGNWKL